MHVGLSVVQVCNLKLVGCNLVRNRTCTDVVG